MAIIGWMDSPVFDRHQNYPEHPESPQRLEAIRAQLATTRIERRLEKCCPRPIDRERLQWVHAAEYIDKIKQISQSGGGALDEDTWVTAHTYDAALLAAGAVEQAVQKVVEGTWTRAFCSVRPPGHHASRRSGAGFCIFNNVAVSAKVALHHDKR